MSTILNTNGAKLEVPEADPRVAGRFYVITADWNPQVTHALRDGAISVLRESGIPENRIISLAVPGTVELVNAAALCISKGKGEPGASAPYATEGVIIIGCVIRGDTPHFDYVCEIAAAGAAKLNALGKAPVGFGVLTVDNLQQALDRAGGCLGNKGAEAADATIRMANLHAQL